MVNNLAAHNLIRGSEPEALSRKYSVRLTKVLQATSRYTNQPSVRPGEVVAVSLMSVYRRLLTYATDVLILFIGELWLTDRLVRIADKTGWLP